MSVSFCKDIRLEATPGPCCRTQCLPCQPSTHTVIFSRPRSRSADVLGGCSRIASGHRHPQRVIPCRRPRSASRRDADTPPPFFPCPSRQTMGGAHGSVAWPHHTTHQEATGSKTVYSLESTAHLRSLLLYDTTVSTFRGVDEAPVLRRDVALREGGLRSIFGPFQLFLKTVGPGFKSRKSNRGSELPVKPEWASAPVYIYTHVPDFFACVRPNVHTYIVCSSD